MKDADEDMKEGKMKDADEDMKEGKDADEDMKKEGKDEADEDMKEGKKKEELDENRPVYKAEDANYAGYSADRVHEDKEFDLDSLLEEINNLDENEDDVNEEVETVEEVAEETNEAMGIAAGIAGIIAAAGGLTALEMKAEDPEFQKDHPNIARMLKNLQKLGGDAAASKRMEEEATAKELEETKEALKAVQTELNEVNLLNSKLLYVNRIFKANQLDEVQKLRVVETLDKAETAKEAKLIYETIKDTFSVAKSKKASFKNKTKSLKEGIGMASKAAGTSTAPKKEVIAESNDMMKRFQKLANIKISQ